MVALGATDQSRLVPLISQVAYVDKMPVVGETVLGNSFGTSFGGKGANQAVMAAKLGGDVAMISKLGNDAIGDLSLNFTLLPEHLRAAGVATHMVGK